MRADTRRTVRYGEGMKSLLFLALLTLSVAADAQEQWVKILRERKAEVIIPGEAKQTWILRVGDCFPLISTREDAYNGINYRWVALRFGDGRFEVGNDAGMIAEATAEDVRKNRAEYERAVAQSVAKARRDRENALAAQQHRDAEDIKANQQLSQWQLEAQQNEATQRRLNRR